MASKNVTQVLIGGKIYTLSGYESEEYLQRVAGYLNGKITQIKTLEGYARMPQEMKSLLLNLNTADDYFKLKAQADQLAEQISAKDRELYEIKHELITVQMRQEKLQRELDNALENRKAAEAAAAQHVTAQTMAAQLAAVQPEAAAPSADQPFTAEEENASEMMQELAVESAENADPQPVSDADEQEAKEQEDTAVPAGEEVIELPDPFHDNALSYAQAEQMSFDLEPDQKPQAVNPPKSTPRKKRKRR